jgi:hypothetical protein
LIGDLVNGAQYFLPNGANMVNIGDLEINLDGLQEGLRDIEKLLNDIIRNDRLTPDEMREKATLCMGAVNRYTQIANRNIHLLNEQTRYLLKKVNSMLEEAPDGSPVPDDPDFDIH